MARPVQPESDTDKLKRLRRQFERDLKSLREARPFAKVNYQGRLYELVVRMVKLPGGSECLYEFAPEFDAAGVFHGGDWDHPGKLQPRWTPQNLRGAAFYVAVELLSQLRFLAIFEGLAGRPDITVDEAREFLSEVLAWNLDILFPDSSEQSRARDNELRQALRDHLVFISQKVGMGSVLDQIVDEAERMLAQRPVMVRRIQSMVQAARRALNQGSHPANPESEDRARQLIAASGGPGKLAVDTENPEQYRCKLSDCGREELLEEAEACARSLTRYGLVSPPHASLLRYSVEKEDLELAAIALALDNVGRASLDAYRALCVRLITEAVFPGTAQCVDGLSALLNNGLLFAPAVSLGLWRLLDAPVDPDVEQNLKNVYPGELAEAGVDGLLAAGALSVLGRPLGIGQGDNPTCQSARAISLWAGSNPGFLLEILRACARDNDLVMYFEGKPLQSSKLSGGLLQSLHTELDIVSLVLVPHLDRIYWAMGKEIVDRGEDGHKWINPEFHGWWVFHGFASCVEYATGAVKNYRDFLRLFYLSYHPAYNGNRYLVYAQPAGIAATDPHGAFIGWHAVAIERVALDPAGETRVYFYNPNNDGGQDWGQDIVTSTNSNGELPGESSLPFHLFAARLYLFHYEPRETGKSALPPDTEIEDITALAKASWAAGIPWYE